MNNTRKMITTAFFIALGLILPMITGHVPAIGKMLLPMHIPVLLCGMIVGWQYGLAAGVITPLLRSFLFGMPPLMPVAAGMAFELAAYGAVAGEDGAVKVINVHLDSPLEKRIMFRL